MQDWPHQLFAVSETLRLREAGQQRMCVCANTGAGKSRIMQRLIEREDGPVLLVTNRVMLLEQLVAGLDKAGLSPGIQASGYAPDIGANVQVASIQSIERWWTAGKLDLHPAKLVLVDEIHNEKGERAERLLGEYVSRGATVVGFTATPIGIKHLVDVLIQAGSTSELRKCGALVAAQTYAPDEPSLKAFKPQCRGILQWQDQHKEVMLHAVFGRIIEHFERLNPQRRPSLLFAPGVSESRWICEQFNRRGIPWSHIDSKEIIINGREYQATRENRAALKKASETGETVGIANRFVMREGIDFPHLFHGIFACTFGSVASYIQAGGRLLRNHPSLSHVVIQDHGGNYWRHDSLNADREWSLEDTDAKIRERHANACRNKDKSEPIVCPKCAKVRNSGAVCPACGFAYKSRRRTIIETDGTLRQVHGDVYRPRKVSTAPEHHKAWKACVFRCKNSGRTFNQARALFQRENGGQVPGPDFPLMPKSEADWYAKVKDVPFTRLSRGAVA